MVPKKVVVLVHLGDVRRRRVPEDPLLLHLALRDDSLIALLVLRVQVSFREQLPAHHDRKKRVLPVSVLPEDVRVVLDQLFPPSASA